MGITNILKTDKFDVFFSFMLGIGIICMIRPMCEGKECEVNKPPSDDKFEEYVYRMGGDKCYEFKTAITECPTSGAIEAFEQRSSVSWTHRETPIKRV